jgi:hypothetical protein
VLARRIQQPSTADALAEEAVAVLGRIGATAAPTRPLLFLHILDRFCSTARQGVPFDASALRQIIFHGEPWVPADCSNVTPLAVMDPLETVKELLDVLEKVAKSCAQRAIAFTSFKLAAPGWFQGRVNDGKWHTIFAYCGGWLKRPNRVPVKCGKSPLYLGQNDWCVGGKLVCRTCGFCSSSCRNCRPRQAEWAAKPPPGDS